MKKLIDKSDGRGCIGCVVETGKVCDGCTHKDDLVNDCKRINMKNLTKTKNCKGCFWYNRDCRPEFMEECIRLDYKFYYDKKPYTIFKIIATILTGLVIIYGASILVKKTASTTFWEQPAPPEVTDAETNHTFDDLLDAIWFVESECGRNSKPGLNGEIGDFQLKKIYIDDCNRILKLNGEDKRVTYADRLNRDESRKIAAYVTSHYANATWKDKPHTRMQFLETAARAHHRPADRGNAKTDAYWDKIKTRMEGR